MTDARKLEYIHELEDGPKTTRDMMLSLCVSRSAVARMMRCLRDERGIVQSSRVPGARGNVWQHELVLGWQELYSAYVAPIRLPRVKTTIATPELFHVAKLRKAGWTGQRLITQYQKTYPNTPPGRVDYMVQLARQRKLCR